MTPVLSALDVGDLPLNAFIWSVALGSSLGGNLSLHAAIGNLLLVEIAKTNADLKVVVVFSIVSNVCQITQWDLVKVGVPVTLLSLTVATVYLIVVWVGISGYH